MNPNIRPFFASPEGADTKGATEILHAADHVHWNATQGLAAIGRLLLTIECSESARKDFTLFDDNLRGLGGLIEMLAEMADEARDIHREAEYQLGKHSTGANAGKRRKAA